VFVLALQHVIAFARKPFSVAALVLFVRCYRPRRPGKHRLCERLVLDQSELPLLELNLR